MSKVLEIIARVSGGSQTNNGTDVEVHAGSAVTDVWFTSDIFLPAASITEMIADQAYADLLVVLDGAHLYGDQLSFTSVDNATAQWWSDGASNGPWGNILGDTWYTVEFHNQYSGGTQSQEIYIDGVSVGPITLGFGQPWTSLKNYYLKYELQGSLTDGNYSVYFRNVTVGTSRGANDIFDMGTLTTTVVPPFDSSVGFGSDVLIVDDPVPPVPPGPPIASGVYIAFGDATLSTNLSYQGIVGVQNWNTDRGRQYELDKTQAGTATVTVIDQDGTYDPTNPDGPWYGKIGPLVPAQIRSVNPVTGATEPAFTGFVESWDYVLDITERWYILTINLTDGFELLNRAETVPDSSGTTILLADLVDDRISGILTDYGWPSGQELIFSGNVHLQESVYNPQTSLLSVLQDCADAELPNVANLFMDKWGQVAFRGRFSRLIPGFYSPRIGGMTPPAPPNQAIDFWECGDRNAAETFGIAPIAAIEWTLDLKNVINAVIATPNGVAQNAIEGQLVANADSIAKYGTRVLSVSDLLTLDQVADPAQGQLSLDAKDACMIFGQYFVDNYAEPVEMISHIEFHTRAVSDSLAGPLWAFICGVEIGDVVKVWTTNPGGGGFRETEFFVEGVHNAVQPLEDDVFDWTQTLDLSPRAWYSVFNGITYYIPPAPPPGLIAAFNATPVIGPASLSVDFVDQSIPGISGPITAWAWDFGDTHTSTSQSPSHTFGSPTPPATGFTVTLTVTGTGSDGTASRSQTITVR